MKAGFNKKHVYEPLFLEKEDYKFKPISWYLIKKLFGFKFGDKVSVIKINISSIEYFVRKENKK